MSSSRSRPSHGRWPSTQRPSEVERQVRETEREAAVHVRPQPEQHRQHDERVPSDDAVRHLDHPEQYQEEEHADQERPLRPEGVDPGERRERDSAGHDPVPHEPQREAVCEQADARADDADEAPHSERADRPVQDAVGDFGEPRLRDPRRTGGGEREDVVVRDAVVEDVLAGPQVPEERIVGQARDPDRPTEQREESREDRAETEPACRRGLGDRVRWTRRNLDLRSRERGRRGHLLRESARSG